MGINFILIVIAAILFTADAFGMPSWRVNRTALGLALLTLTLLIGR